MDEFNAKNYFKAGFDAAKSGAVKSLNDTPKFENWIAKEFWESGWICGMSSPALNYDERFELAKKRVQEVIAKATAMGLTPEDMFKEQKRQTDALNRESIKIQIKFHNIKMSIFYEGVDAYDTGKSLVDCPVGMSEKDRMTWITGFNTRARKVSFEIGMGHLIRSLDEIYKKDKQAIYRGNREIPTINKTVVFDYHPMVAMAKPSHEGMIMKDHLQGSYKVTHEKTFREELAFGGKTMKASEVNRPLSGWDYTDDLNFPATKNPFAKSNSDATVNKVADDGWILDPALKAKYNK